MKKLFMLAAFSAVLMLSSCHNTANKGEESTNDSIKTETVDTTVVDSVSVDSIPTDTIQ